MGYRESSRELRRLLILIGITGILLYTRALYGDYSRLIGPIALSISTLNLILMVDSYWTFRIAKIKELSLSEIGHRLDIEKMQNMMKKFWVWPLEKFL